MAKGEETELAQLRRQWSAYDRKKALLKPPLAGYAAYYRKFKKTYPVLLQLESLLLKGKDLQTTCLAVETMFLAEVKHCLLVAGHDASQLSGQGLQLDLAQGGESFTTVAGRAPLLKSGDMFMADNGKLLSSVLEGQDFHTRLTQNSTAATYCVYGLNGVSESDLLAFFRDLQHYSRAAFPQACVERVFCCTAKSA